VVLAVLLAGGDNVFLLDDCAGIGDAGRGRDHLWIFLFLSYFFFFLIVTTFLMGRRIDWAGLAVFLFFFWG